MSHRIERKELPGHKALCRLVGEDVAVFGEGTRLVDDDARGATGVDLVLVDTDGRPLLVDVVAGAEREIAARLFEHRAWLVESGRLFLKAYGREGVLRTDDAVVVFVCGEVPESVSAAVAALGEGGVRVYRAEAFSVDDEDVLSLEDVTPVPVARPVSPEPSGEQEEPRDETEVETGIRSHSVRALFDLFESGVDGLDGRIEASSSEEGVVFELSGRRLARVTWSPESFTVTVGQGRSNPIVVSDRVSLERALNAVVSYFVREEEPGRALDVPEVSEDVRSELAAVWSGVASEE